MELRQEKHITVRMSTDNRTHTHTFRAAIHADHILHLHVIESTRVHSLPVRSVLYFPYQLVSVL